MIDEVIGVDYATGKVSGVFSGTPRTGPRWLEFVESLLSHMPPTSQPAHIVADSLACAIVRLYAQSGFTPKTHEVAYETCDEKIQLRLQIKPMSYVETVCIGNAK